MNEISLKSIRIKNILSFKDALFDDLSPFSVIIGPNNVGKSNLFKILNRCIPQSAIPKNFSYNGIGFEECEVELEFRFLEEEILEFLKFLASNFSNVDTFENMRIEISSKGNFYVPALDFFKNVIIKIGFTKNSPFLRFFGFRCKNEEFNFFKDDNLYELSVKDVYDNPKYKYFKSDLDSPTQFLYSNLLKNSLNGLRKSHKTAFFFLSRIRDFFINMKYLVDVRDFPKIAPANVSDKPIESNGSNFTQVFFGNHTNIPEKIVEFNEKMKVFYLDLNKVFQHTSNKQMTTLLMDQKNLNLDIEFDFVGKGMYQIAIFIMILLDCKENQLVLIDEPELHLHPHLQKKLLQFFKEFTDQKKIQIIIATHSSFFLNNLSEQDSIYLLSNKKEEKTVKKMVLDDYSIIFDTLGIFPSDFFFYNGLLLVEGKDDVKFFHYLLEELLDDKKIKIKNFQGKNNLHFWADHKLISTLTKNNFKFLIILDLDEGNKKIYDDIKDPEVKKNIFLLPVREIENFELNPELLFNYINKFHPELEQLLKDSEEIKKIENNLISKDLIWEKIVKSFLDEFPLGFNNDDRDYLLDSSNSDSFFEKISVLTDKKGFTIQKNVYSVKFNKIQKKVDEMKDEGWKYFAGKKFRSKLINKFKEHYNIELNSKKIRYLLKTDKFTKEEFIDKIEFYFNTFAN